MEVRPFLRLCQALPPPPLPFSAPFSLPLGNTAVCAQPTCLRGVGATLADQFAIDAVAAAPSALARACPPTSPPPSSTPLVPFPPPRASFSAPPPHLRPLLPEKCACGQDPWGADAARGLVPPPPLPASPPPQPSPADPLGLLAAAGALVRGAAAAAAAVRSSPRCFPLPSSSCCPWRPEPRPTRPCPLSLFISRAANLCFRPPRWRRWWRTEVAWQSHPRPM